MQNNGIDDPLEIRFNLNNTKKKRFVMFLTVNRTIYKDKPGRYINIQNHLAVLD